MPKSQIIKDIVENRVPLEQSLNRLYILAMDVKNTKLAQWAQKELIGYDTSDSLPEYRCAKCSHFRYTGLYGDVQATRAPLPVEFLKSETKKKYSQVDMYDGIRYIEDLSNSSQTAIRDLTFLAAEVEALSNGAVSCFSIYNEIPPSIPQRICSIVRSKMITALLTLEETYGNLDSLGVNVSEKKNILVQSTNDSLNRTIFNINLPSEAPEKKQPWYSKIAWNIVFPIITAIVGAVVAAIIIQWLSL